MEIDSVTVVKNTKKRKRKQKHIVMWHSEKKTVAHIMLQTEVHKQRRREQMNRQSNI